MATNREILLEKWEPSDENPISKAGNIAYTEGATSQYYAGMHTYNDKRSVVGFTRILSNKPFCHTKKMQI